MIVDKANPSQDYKDLINSYKELHKNEGTFKGISLRPLVPSLHKIIKNNLHTYDCICLCIDCPVYAISERQ